MWVSSFFMSSLISILNSGESLEKAIVLTKLAFEYNFDFYSNYDKIKVLYYENLPKKEKGLMVHGTLGALIEGLEAKGYCKYGVLSDLWEDRDYILGKMCSLGRISERMKESILNDKSRFDKIVPHFPWYFILEDFRNFLIHEFLNCDSVTLEYLDFKKTSEEILKKTPQRYEQLIKPYILNPDGSISSRILQQHKAGLKLLKNSIVVSPNVFMFILGSYYSYCEKDTSLLIGFRKFSKSIYAKGFGKRSNGRFLVPYRRNSYDKGIEYLHEQRGSNCVEEPRNVLFNNLLDKIDRDYGKISVERKINLAIYGYLNKLL